MKLSTYVIAVPAVVIAAALAVANRRDVVFSLDPFSQSHPSIAVEMPLFVLLFLVLVLGILLGGAASALSRLWRNRRRLPTKTSKPNTPPG